MNGNDGLLVSTHLQRYSPLDRLSLVFRCSLESTLVYTLMSCFSPVLIRIVKGQLCMNHVDIEPAWQELHTVPCCTAAISFERSA